MKACPPKINVCILNLKIPKTATFKVWNIIDKEIQNDLRRVLCVHGYSGGVELDGLQISILNRKTLFQILATLGFSTILYFWLDKKIYLVYIYPTCRCLDIFKNCKERKHFTHNVFGFNVS